MTEKLTSPNTLPENLLPPHAIEVLAEREVDGLKFLVQHPATNIHIHFSKHVTASDLGDENLFEVPLSNADIYAFELYRYVPAQEKLVRDLAMGSWLVRLSTITTKSSFDRRENKAIYKSGIIPIIADMPINHPKPDTNRTHKLIQERYKGDCVEDWPHSEAIIARLVATDRDAREWVILATLGMKLEELTKINPSIAQKIKDSDLNIFWTIGASHTTVFYKLRNMGLKPTRSFPQKPYLMNPDGIRVRQQMFKIQKVPDSKP